MQQSQFIQFINRHKLALLVMSTIFVLLLIASRFSFITIKVQSPSTNGEFTYRITDSTGKTSKTTSDKPSYRKLVARGSYTVEASQNDKNFFAFTSTSGFFLNKKVEANLLSEKSRNFVGDNPDICMSYSSNILLSYLCGGTMKSLKAHMPAVNSQATLARMIEASGDQIEGMARIDGKSIAVIKTVGADSAESARLITTVDQNGLSVSEGAFHSELSSPNPYEVKHYRDGFVVLGENSSELRYYRSAKDRGETISLSAPKDTKLSRYAWGTSPNSIALAYFDVDRRAAEDPHDDKTHGTTTIVLLQDNKSKQVKIGGYFTDVLPCGTKKLCVVNNKKLLVYDVSGRTKLLFTLPGVQAIDNSGDSLLVATENNILAVDVDKQSGGIDFSLGGYTYCGMNADPDGYQLCLINEQQRKVALRVDRSKENANNIDKKILQLNKSKAVSTISIYGNTIVVVPNYGAKVYDPVQKIYTNDPATVARMNAEFAKDLQASGISTSEYTVSGLSQ